MARKYRSGEIIKTLEELDRQESIMFNNKTINRAAWQNWQFNFIKSQLNMGRLRIAINKSDYDFVKGYKSPLDTLPKDIKEIVRTKLLERIEPELVSGLMLEVDVYYSIDIRNAYQKE